MSGAEREHLSPTMIAAIAIGDAPESAFESHLDSCRECREAVLAAREENEYLDRVRTLAAPVLGPEDAPRVPGYRIVERVGSGAQADVYRAVQASTSRTVAIKVVHHGGADRASWRAEHEAEIAAGLRHPGLVTVYESLVLEDGRTATIMEFVEGEPIDKWRGGAGAPEQRLSDMLGVFVRVCDAVHHAHLNGVVHRDIKPENVLVGADGSPVVLDFGVARRGETWRTHAGEIAGTPAYASPEQMSGEPGAIDALTDVYSLGVLLYKLLCGRLPYTLEGSLTAVAATIVGVPPTPLREVDPSIPADLDSIVMRALQKDKGRRYQSAAALGADVRRYLQNQPVEARGESGWYLLQKLASRNRGRIAGVAVALLVVAGGSIAVVRSMSEAAAAERREEQQREQARLDHLRSRAVTELMRLTIPAADPSHPEIGESVAAGFGRLYALLESGAYADEPELDQEIRRLWGGVYTDSAAGKGTEFVEYSEVSLRNGLIRLRLRDPEGRTPEIAAGVYELAGVLLVRGRMGEAERMARESVALHRDVHGDASPATARSIALLSRVLAAGGRLDEAVASADEAIAVFDSAPGAGTELTRSAMMTIKARSAIERRDAVAAERFVLDAMRVRLRRSLLDDPELHESLVQAGELYAMAPNASLSQEVGRIWGGSGTSVTDRLRDDIAILRTPLVSLSGGGPGSGRTEAIGRVLRLQEHILGADHPAVVGMLMTRTQAAWAESSHGVRVEALLRAADILAKRFGASDLGVLMCVEEAASVEAFIGRPGRAVELGVRADAIWRSIPAHARDGLLATNARRKLAWYLALAGRYDEAEAMNASVLDEFVGLVGAEHYLVALTRSGLAFCAAELGDVARADVLSFEASTAAGGLAGIPSDTAAHIGFTRGHVLCRLGRYGEARPYLEGAWRGFYRDAYRMPWCFVLAADMADACEGLGDHEAAAAWRAMLDPPPASAAND